MKTDLDSLTRDELVDRVRELEAQTFPTAQGRHDVLAIVAHDLKNQLTGILLSADVLLMGPPVAEHKKSRHHVEQIKRAVAQMRWIVQDLLDLSGIETGRTAIDRDDHLATDLLREAIALLEPLASDNGVTLELLAAAPFRVRCDRNRVVQVLTNLIGNAIKLTPQGEKITAGADQRDGKVRFRIHHRGAGMSNGALPNLFRRYWQTAESAAKGRGLTLHIGRAIVEAQGGSLWAESGEGEGTTFQLALPAVSEA